MKALSCHSEGDRLAKSRGIRSPARSRSVILTSGPGPRSVILTRPGGPRSVILTSSLRPGEEGSAGGFHAPGFDAPVPGLVARQGQAPRNDKRIRRLA
jgi:hypothetical protein